MIKENNKAPNFTLPSSSGTNFELNDNLNDHLVIYFYPKDNTPGCTTESVEFAKQYKQLKKLKVEVVGISRDSIESHNKFIKKFTLPFQLLSDETTKVLKLYGAWGQKSMYGKKFMGIKRTTILINNKGIIKKIWNNVKVKDHVTDVLNIIQDAIKK